MNPQFFVLLEIADPTVNAFLWSVRRVLSGGKAKASPIHITLRGPYEERRDEALEAAKETLKGDVLEIGGVGRFSNGESQVLFFKVNSPHLRAASWKRDYPIERFGFEPHISVYRGQNSKLVERAEALLVEQGIRLFCAEYRLIWHQLEQPSLFSSGTPAIGDMAMLPLSTHVDTDVIDRLQAMVHALHLQQAESLAQQTLG